MAKALTFRSLLFEGRPDIAMRRKCFSPLGPRRHRDNCIQCTSWTDRKEMTLWSGLASLKLLILRESKSVVIFTIPPRSEQSISFLHVWLHSVHQTLVMSLPCPLLSVASNYPIWDICIEKKKVHCYGIIAKYGPYMFLETGLSSVMETESIHILLSRELNIMTFWHLKKSWGDLVYSPRVWQDSIVWIKLLALNFIMHVMRRRERTLWDHLSLVTSLKFFFLFELGTESCPLSILKIIASFPFFIEHCGKNFLLMSRLTEASLMAVDDPLLWVFIDSFFLEASHPDTLYFILISGIVFISSNFLKKHILFIFSVLSLRQVPWNGAPQGTEMSASWRELWPAAHTCFRLCCLPI